MDDATAAQVRELVSKGVMGGWVGFVTDDCRKTYDELSAKGVEFTDGPNEQPYGIDAGIRDPFGNKLRFVQLRAVTAHAVAQVSEAEVSAFLTSG